MLEQRRWTRRLWRCSKRGSGFGTPRPRRLRIGCFGFWTSTRLQQGCPFWPKKTALPLSQKFISSTIVQWICLLKVRNPNGAWTLWQQVASFKKATLVFQAVLLGEFQLDKFIWDLCSVVCCWAIKVYKKPCMMCGEWMHTSVFPAHPCSEPEPIQGKKHCEGWAWRGQSPNHKDPAGCVLWIGMMLSVLRLFPFIPVTSNNTLSPTCTIMIENMKKPQNHQNSRKTCLFAKGRILNRRAYSGSWCGASLKRSDTWVLGIYIYTCIQIYTGMCMYTGQNYIYIYTCTVGIMYQLHTIVISCYIMLYYY